VHSVLTQGKSLDQKVELRKLSGATPLTKVNPKLNIFVKKKSTEIHAELARKKSKTGKKSNDSVTLND
jgi:hypothetical protein